MSTAETKETWNVIVGSLCVAFGLLCFNTNEVIVKWSELNVSQLLFGRYCVQCIIAICWWNFKKAKDNTYISNWYGDPPFIRNIFCRALCYGFSVVALWYSVKRLPVGDVSAIILQGALITALFGRIFLKEELPKMFVFIAIFAIIGSLLISQPTFLFYLFGSQNVEPLPMDGLIAIFIVIILWSLSNILTRTAIESHFLQLELVSSTLMIFVIIPIILLLNNYLSDFQSIGTFNTFFQFDLFSLVIVCLCGSIGFIGLSLCVIGYQLGDATKVSWLEYIIIVYSSLFQTFIFNDPFNLPELIGIMLISISCFISLAEQYYNYIKAKNKRQKQLKTASPECEQEIDMIQCPRCKAKIKTQ